MQFTKNDWRNRNKIKTPNGVEWISIPVGQGINRRIRDVTLVDNGWNLKHWNMLKSNYARAGHFNEVREWLEPIYLNFKSENLSSFNRQLIEAVCSYLGIKTKLSNSWDYSLGIGKTERLVGLCQQTMATEYIEEHLFNDISENDLREFRTNPLGYVSGTQEFKGYIALAYPKQLMPLMAHSYDFPWFINGCDSIARLHRSAIAFIRNNMDDHELATNKSSVEAEVALIEDALNNQSHYINRCPEGVPASVDFKIYQNHDDSIVYLKLIPPNVAVQGRDF